MRATTRAVLSKAGGIKLGSALILMILLAVFLQQEALKAEPIAWDPLLLDAPRPSPCPLGFRAGSEFRRSLVQLSDGGLRLGFLDLYLPSGSEPLLIKRLYRSSLQTGGVFGTGWASNLDMRLTMAGTGAPRIVESDGRTTGYEAGPDGHFKAINGTFPASELAHLDKQWIRTWQNGPREIFDDLGRLVERVNGADRLTLSYDEAQSRLPASISDSANHILRLRYRDGLLVEAAYPDQRTIRYGYDGRILSETTDAIGRHSRFIYADGRMTRLELPLGANMEFHYAPAGNLSQVVGPGGLATTFEWSFDPKSATIRLAASSAGSTEAVEIKPEAVDMDQWGIAGKTPRPAMQIIHALRGGKALSAHLLGDKVLLDGPDGRSVLDPKATDSEGADATGDALDPHEWRLSFTPAMAHSRYSDATYDAAGRPIAVAIDDSTKESWKWDQADRIVAWTDAEGTTSEYEYDALDRPVRITVGGEPVVSAEYNGLGLLSRLTDGDGSIGYEYAGSGNLSRITVKDGSVIDVKRDGAGRPVAVTIDGKPSMNAAYDDAGRLVNLAAADGKGFRYTYDKQGNLQDIVDPAGGTTSYRPTNAGNGVNVSYPDGTKLTRTNSSGRDHMEMTAADGRKSAITYDRDGRILEAQAPDQPKFLFSYRTDGQLESATSSDGKTRQFEYDAASRLVRELAKDGTSIDFTYDEQGRLTAYATDGDRAAFTYGPDGGLSITTDQKGLTGSLGYDADGRLVEHVDSTGAAWRFGYTSAGDVQGTGPAGDSLTYRRDDNGRVAEVEYTSEGKTARQRYRYDKQGRTVEVGYEDGTFTQVEYDSRGNIAKMRDRLGNSHAFRFTARGRIAAIDGPLGAERWTYDSQDRLIAHEDPTEAATRFEYSKDGNSITTIDPDGGRTRVTLNDAGQTVNVRDADGGTIGREYDEQGLPSGFIDPNDHKTTWTYDATGRAIERRTPLGKTFRLAYDESGRLIESSSPDNKRVKRDYDQQGRLSGMETSDGEAWTFTYDGAGDIATVEGSSGGITYKRDALGRVTASSDGAGASVAAAYDAAGRIVQIVAPKGDRIAYAYNSLGQLSATTTKAGSIEYAYDKAGRIARIDYPNGTRTSYRYLSGFRIGSIATTGRGGGLLLEETYEYDRRGNVAAIMRKGKAVEGAGAASGALLGRSAFAYDALNRIVSAQFADGTRERFSFDPAGNLTKRSAETKSADGGKSLTAQTLRYDADQALVQVNDRVHRPDPNGSFCADDTGCAGAYDAFNRLRKWRDQSYSYDSDGHLTDWRDGKGNGGHLVSLERQLLAELGLGDRPDRFYVAAPDEPLWAAVSVGDQDYYPIRSANGSLLAATDKDGRIARLCSYYTFATGPAWSSAENAPPCEYAGGRELGPGVWFGARVFSSTGARFLTRDTAGPDKDGNFYAYALGNPLRFVDRQGTNSTPAYRQMLDQLGVDQSPAGVRDFLVKQLETEAVGHPDLSARQEAEALARAIKPDLASGSSTVPLDIGRVKTGYAEYSAGRATLDIRKLAETATSPQDFVQRMKGAIAHEVGGHGLGFQDVQPWSQGVTRPYSQLQEVSAFMNQRRFDKTLAGMDPLGAYRSDEEALQWVVNHVTEKTEKTINLVDGEEIEIIVREAPEPYRPAAIAEQNAKRLAAAGEEEFFTHTIRPTKDPVTGKILEMPVADNVNKLKQLRLEQAAESAGRTPVAAAGKAGAVEGTVSRALSREATVLEKASAKGAAIGKTVGNALNSIKSKAHAALGKAGSAAKRAFSFITRKFAPIGRIAKYLIPAAGQVLAVKDAIDTALGIGGVVGEAAFDIYSFYRKGGDAILNALDKLMKDMEALDDKADPKRKKKKARQAELQASLSPEPAQIGMPSGNTAPAGEQPSAGGSAVGQPQQEMNAGPATEQPAEAAKPERPLGPTTPLGGKDAQAGPKPKPGDQANPKPENPKPENPKPPEAEAKPAEPKPKAADQKPGEKPSSSQQAASGKPVKEWDAMCGGSMEAVVAGMTNSTIPPAIVPTCLCFYFLKKHVPDLKPEAIVDPPPQRDACGAYITAMKEKKPEEVAKAEPQPQPEKAPEPEKETAEAQPEEAPAPPESEPQEAPKETAETPPPLEDGLPPPEVPDVLKPRAQQPEPEPEPAPQPKPSPPVYEPERPSSTELEKPNLYDMGPKVTSSAMTPKETATAKPDSGSAGGGGLAGAYKWAAGWLGYVSGKIN